MHIKIKLDQLPLAANLEVFSKKSHTIKETKHSLKQYLTIWKTKNMDTVILFLGRTMK